MYSTATRSDSWPANFVDLAAVTTAGYKQFGGDRSQFRTEWRGISTMRSGLSCYALALPVDAVPEQIAFTDPHSPDHAHRYSAVFDRRRRRVACYLECRSKLGTFDFDLLVDFRRDAAGCASFTAHEGGSYTPDLQDLERMAAFGTPGEVVVQQFFDSSVALNVGDRSIVVNQSDLRGPIVGEVSGTVGAIGGRARGEVKLDLAEVFSAHRGQLRDELLALRDAAEGDVLLQAELAVTVTALETGDVSEASGALRRIGSRGLHLARDLGVNLAAAVIAAQLGIGP